MLSSVPALRAELAARLTEALPSEWEIRDALMAPNVGLVPAVYLEFQELSGTADGAPLPRGCMCASVDVVFVDPRTADEIAEDAVDTSIVPVLQALDAHADIGWSTAKKVRLDAGPLAWRISTIALVNLTTT